MNADRYTREIQNALDLYQNERFPETEQVCRKLITYSPERFEAYYYMAMLAYRHENYDSAVAFMNEAITRNPGSAALRSDLGAFHKMLNRLDLAEKAYREAIEIDPNFALAHANLANTLRLAGKPRLAVAAAEKALTLKTDFPEALNNLGAALCDLDDFEKAETHLKKALRVKDGFVDGMITLAGLYVKTGRTDDAIAMAEKALAVIPENPDAVSVLGLALSSAGKDEQAIEYALRAVALRPGSADFQYNLGLVLENADRPGGAMTAYEKAVALKPEAAEALTNLGCLLLRAGRLEEAILAHRKAVAINPSLVKAYSNLGSALLAQGRHREALAAYEKALENNAKSFFARSGMLFLFCYANLKPPADVAREYAIFDAIHAAPLLPSGAPAVSVKRGDKLRVGYVSPDFRKHSVAFYIEPILEHHDRDAFEVYCYSNVRKPDDVTARIRRLPLVWRDISRMSDEAAAKLVRQDRIDILVDLAGHTRDSRLLLLARRPAPVQASYLGYPQTTGLSAIDYRIVDWQTDPAGAELFATEKLIRLPDGFHCYRPPETSPDVAPAPREKNSFTTFGSFNNIAKITAEVVECWSEILKRTPNSRLLLKHKFFCDAGTRNFFLKLFAKNGVARDRIMTLAAQESMQQHLDTYAQIDLALDPFPYNGTTTTCEALWMGAPVLTLTGNTHAGRVGESLLFRTGLTAFVAATQSEYVEKAVAFETTVFDRSARLNVRQRLQSSPLMDEQKIVRQLEAAYRKIATGEPGADER